MITKEYRIVLPLTVDEYLIAQLYSIAEASKRETGGGEGVEILTNQAFHEYRLPNGKLTSGQYTHKIYHLSYKAPPFIRMLAPKGSLEIEEQAWNAYPYCKTIVSNPAYMKDKFEIVIESMHLPDRGIVENVHVLPPDRLKDRTVIIIDIGNDPVRPSDYDPKEDPSIFISRKTGRGPLTGDWIDTVSPVMTCYKLVTCEFKWFGLQKRIETFIQKTERRLFTNLHRQVFCWIDIWHDLTLEDVRKMELETKRELDEQRKQGEVRGLKAKDND